MTAPGGPARDGGPFGAPGAREPGVADAVRTRLFWPSTTRPPLSAGVGQQQSISIGFEGGVPAAGSLTLDVVRAETGQGVELDIDFQVVGGELVVQPPPGGWGSEPFVLELHAPLRSTEGTPLSHAAGPAHSTALTAPATRRGAWSTRRRLLAPSGGFRLDPIFAFSVPFGLTDALELRISP